MDRNIYEGEGKGYAGRRTEIIDTGGDCLVIGFRDAYSNFDTIISLGSLSWGFDHPLNEIASELVVYVRYQPQQ